MVVPLAGAMYALQVMLTVSVAAEPSVQPKGIISCDFNAVVQP